MLGCCCGGLGNTSVSPSTCHGVNGGAPLGGRGGNFSTSGFGGGGGDYGGGCGAGDNGTGTAGPGVTKVVSFRVQVTCS